MKDLLVTVVCIIFGSFCTPIPWLIIGIICYRNRSRKVKQKIAKYRKAWEDLKVSSLFDPSGAPSDCCYDDLNVFPYYLPYNSHEEELSPFQETGIPGPENMNTILQALRGYMPNLIYMRGDNHNASDSDTKVLLLIKIIKQEGNELAIAPVVVSRNGLIVSYSVRHTCWPGSIFSPNWSPAKIDPKALNLYDFFPPQKWLEGRIYEENGQRFYKLEAEFGNETKRESRSLADAASKVLIQMVGNIRGTGSTGAAEE